MNCRVAFCVFLLVAIAQAYVQGEAPTAVSKNAPDIQYAGGITIQHGIVEVGQLGDTSACPVKPWSPEQEAARVYVEDVVFEREYAQVPAVILSLQKLDSSNQQNLRFSIEALEVTTAGFKLKFEIWCDTVVYSAKVAWQAIETAI